MTTGDIRDTFGRLNITIEKMIKLSPRLEQDLAAAIKHSSYVAVIGGDGTISAVANILVETNAVLVPLPGGTLNNFTKTLGINQDIEQALQELATSSSKRIDIASVNGMYFVNNSSIGLYPRSLKHREQFESAIGKWPAAIIGLYRAIFRFHSYYVSIDGEEFKTPFIFVGNNEYNLENGTVRDKLNAGVLSVYIVKSSRRIDLLRIFVASLARRPDIAKNFEHRTVKKLVINTKKVRSVSVSHDGEVSKINSPLTYEIHHNSLRVLG